MKKKEMANLAQVEKLQYCDKASGSGHCSKIATRQIRMCKKDEPDDSIHLKQIYGYRCEDHAFTSTFGYKVFESRGLDQDYKIDIINKFLKSIIGKNIKSHFHTARELEVRYLKDNCGVMCFQPISKKWKFVYYEQIDEIIK